MLTRYGAVLALLIVVAASPAHADKRKRKPKPAPEPAPATSPATGDRVPGTCAYRPRDDGKPGTMRDCWVGGQGRLSGEWSIPIARNAAVQIQFDEPITMAVPKSDSRMRIGLGSDFIVYDVTGNLPSEGWVATVQTASYTVTLHFQLVDGGQGDSAVFVGRADRGARDAELDRRLAEERAKLEADYDKRLAALDRKAATLARQHMVDEVHAGYGTHDPGVRPTRDDDIVLRAERVIRIGSSRYLELTVQNKDSALLHIETVQVSIEGAAARPLKAPWTCDTRTVRVRKRARCTIAFESDSDRSRVRLTVTTKDGRRSVSLGGIDAR